MNITTDNTIYTNNLIKVLVSLYADKKVVQYLTLVLSGANNKEIKDIMKISSNTLSSYKKQYESDLSKLLN